jgi:probable rRNA maturation factor
MEPEGQRGALRVVVGDERGRPVTWAPRLSGWLARVARGRARGLVSVALLSDARMRALNRRFRGRDYATDVLSFPVLDSPPRTPRTRRPESFLGDIVIARGVARRQAREAGHSELTELRVLTLHGFLHLLGYDHERDAGRMQRLERRLRRRGGLDTGLLERARAVPRAVKARRA